MTNKEATNIESGPELPEKVCRALARGEDVSIHVDAIQQLRREDWSSFVRAGAKQVRICVELEHK